MRPLFVSILLLLCLVYAHSQVASVNGRVIEEGRNRAISGASLFVRGIPVSTVSGKEGDFQLSNVPFGLVEIQVRKQGYQPISIKVTIASIANSLTVKLIPTKETEKPGHLKALNKYREKVVVVTDKPYYYPREIIWLKAYLDCLDPTLKDSLSRVAYIDLIGSDNKLLKHLVLSLDSGKFQGQIALPREIKPGNYMLVAYTNFMRNFSEDYFYYQTVPILSINERVDVDESIILEDTNEIVLDKKHYSLRDKVSISFHDFEEGDYTISVTDATQVAATPQTSFTETWGFLKYPAEDDALFDYVTEKGIRFIGQFVNEYNTAKRVKLTFYRKDRFELTEAETDDRGMFQLNGLQFFDSAKYFATAYSAKSKKPTKIIGNIKLIEQSIPKPKISVPGRWFKVVDSNDPQRFLAGYLVPTDSKLLDTVTVKATRLTDGTEKLPGIIGGADATLLGQDVSTYPSNLVMGLAGKVPGLVVDCGDPSRCSISFNRANTSSFFNIPGPLVLVDNVPMAGQSAGETLLSIDPLTVERVEFKRGLAPLYGSQAAGGIIAVYLKKGQTTSSEKRFEMEVNLKGFSKPRSFVSPDYGSSIQDTSIADYRSTLYWNPELSRNSVGYYSCSFYTSDMPGKYRITVTGVTKSNKPIRLVKYFEVRE